MKKEEKNKKKEDLSSNASSSDKKKNKNKNKYLISTTIVLLISALVGAGGGFLFYRWQNPQSATLSLSGSEGYVPTKAEVEKSLKAGTLLSDYQDKYYQLLNYSLSLQQESSYSLTIGKAKVVSSGVTQNVVSCNYTTPEVIYNQNVSSSALVKTANRFYDRYDEKVTCYLESVPDDWTKASNSVEYTYDEYMQKYGKLLLSSYYCTSTTDMSQVTEATPIADRYLSREKQVYDSCQDKTKHHVNGVIIYLVGPHSVKSSKMEKKGSTYHIELELFTDKDKKQNTDPQKKITPANSYYSVQMRTTGGLASRPVFSQSKLQFELDENLYLKSSYFYDEYTAVVGPINSPATSEMTQYYFHSDSDTFDDVKVVVPNYNDADIFAGYQLFPREG